MLTVLVCCRRGNGEWSSDGITTFYVNGSQQVLCNSTHLTSFAVLVDVSGVHTVRTASTHFVCFKPYNADD